MDLAEALKRRFNGKMNGLFLVISLVVCFRFAGAEWKDEPLQFRMLFSAYLLAGVVATGIIFAIARVALTKINPPRWKSESRIGEDIAWGLKFGMVLGTLFIFFGGLMLVDNYLGPFQALIDTMLEKLAKYLP